MLGTYPCPGPNDDQRDLIVSSPSQLPIPSSVPVFQILPPSAERYPHTPHAPGASCKSTSATTPRASRDLDPDLPSSRFRGLPTPPSPPKLVKDKKAVVSSCPSVLLSFLLCSHPQVLFLSFSLILILLSLVSLLFPKELVFRNVHTKETKGYGIHIQPSILICLLSRRPS